MKQGLYILLSILLFCQCKKEGFDNLEETPVFGIETNFKGSDIDIQAGIDGYYMYSSFDQIDADHLILNGRLANESAETSSLTSPFEFEWNITTEIGSIDDLLSLSSLEYQTKNQVAVGVRMITLFNFNSDVHPSSVQMNWTIDNDLVSTEFYPVVPFETIASNQFTDVHLDFAIPNVMTGSFDAQLSFSDFCGGFLSIQKINENQFSFAVNPASDLPSDVLWSTGSTNGSTIRPREAQEIFVDIHAEDESCSSRIKVDIEDPDFNRLNIGFIPQQPALAAETGSTADQQINTINFKLTDSDGIIYTTYEVKQAQDAYFNFEAMRYETNELGMETLLIDAIFSARLISQDKSRVVTLEDAKATFAVAIP